MSGLGNLRVGLTALARLFACLMPLLNLAGHAASSPSDECHLAAARASQHSGVPLDVLTAISLTETGRRLDGIHQPWPWTVNMEGQGKWFDTRLEAQSYVDKNFDRGARSFDVGCFQINFKWHGGAFQSIDQMFDPDANAHYAARFLLELFDEFGDWSKAAGAFHSRTPKYAKKYRARFDLIRSRLPKPDPYVQHANYTGESNRLDQASWNFRRDGSELRQLSAGSLVLLHENPTHGRLVRLTNTLAGQLQAD